MKVEHWEANKRRVSALLEDGDADPRLRAMAAIVLEIAKLLDGPKPGPSALKSRSPRPQAKRKNVRYLDEMKSP